MQTNLAGQVAFVTGAAGAIGSAIARRLADNGAGVVIADINAEGAQKVAGDISGAVACALDIRDSQSINDAVASTLKHFGRLDILVNNAGVNTLAHRVNID